MNDRGRGAAPRFQHSELALALRAVRALDASPTTRGRTPAVFLFSAILLGLLHTAAVTRFPSYPVGATASAAFGAGNEDVSMQFKKMAAVVSSALAVSAGAHAQDAVQWRIEDGGNGHWYQRVSLLGSTWLQSRNITILNGGHLVTITSAQEQGIVQGLVADSDGNHWVGAWQPDGSEGPWRWITGESWEFENGFYDDCAGGGACLPCNGGSVQDYLVIEPSGIWNDSNNPNEPICGCCPDSNWRGYIVEFSADCNSDGIVDYGQIRAGELVDTNANNIPDCCEQGVSCDPCPGDIDESGTVNGVDLAAILAVWGSDGGKYPRADTNNDGEVNGADLATVLGSWGSCE